MIMNLDIFSIFRSEQDERQWTQWLGALLDGRAGERARAFAWESFCCVTASSARERGPTCKDEPIAGEKDWVLAGKSVPRICVELPSALHGQLDLFAETPELVAVIENKVRATWSNKKGEEPQPERYRRLGAERRRNCGAPYLGLVILTCKKNELCPPEWVVVSWQDYARDLRRALKTRFLDREPRPEEILELWPIAQTLFAIEHHLIGLPLEVLRTKSTDEGFAQIPALLELEKYLETIDEDTGTDAMVQ